ncbi:uncharacterized protein LOC111648290 [Seriola lalandi dorsalis]|uniref:uncharacterized protein LOC111648290 n=1 Tax=Seriola lalandi dorsalis TaxID=1841481 RepID=UPI000C6FC315|nr:uncharacterized protein LOC111648290 [Seriola lalandi dorsalis]
MRIPFACLLLLSATVLSQDVSDRYRKFIAQHINGQMSVNRCDDEIRNRHITKTDSNECKETNTFIRATTNIVKSICERAGEPYECRDDQNFVTKTVHVGEDVTLTCSRHEYHESGTLFWIRLVAGNLPEVLGATYTFASAYFNKTPRITAKQEPGTFVLHITRTELRPEPDITAVIQVPSSDPARLGDSVTLQCSVLSHSEKKTCSGDPSVYWFRGASDESYPSVIYAHGNSGDECERSPDAHSPQKCVYNFSMNITSSDAGTYYCAVATCGEILFGNGAKLEIEGQC